MIIKNNLLRAQRTTRLQNPRVFRNIRFASETAQKAKPQAPSSTGALTGGLVGGGAALVVTYAWYHFSGAKSALQTAKQAKGYIDSATDQLKVKFQEKTPDDTNEAIQTLRDAANKYAAFVPGGKGYVDSAFNDLESIRKQHGQEVDNIVREAYEELREVSKKGVSLESASQAYHVLSKHFQRLFELGGDTAQDILNNHPQLKEKLGGSTDKLKQLGEQYGPEAKKQVDETWQEINQVLQAGFSADAVERVRKLVQEKSGKIRQMGEQAFDQGFEQIKPMLEKSPKVKQFVEENMETLKQGNATETMEKVSGAVSSGNTQNLEKYLQQVKDKTQHFSSSQLSQWLEMVPNGSQIIPQLQKLKDLAEKQGAQAQDLAKETIGEIKQVLDKKSQRVEELYEGGKEEVKRT